MMKYSLRYELKTITPVHIGTGSKYNSVEYVLSGGKLYRISLDKLLNELSGDEIEDLTERLGDYRFSLTDFLSSKSVNLAAITRYAVRFQGGGVKEITEQIKTSDRAYIPGTSIKGAIRTAIIYKRVKDDYTIVDNELERIKSNRRLMDNLNRNMMRSLAYKDKWFSRELRRVMENIEARVLRGLKNDAKYDMLKFLQITDSSTTSNLAVFTVITSGMSREDRAYTQIEAISKGVVLNGSMVLNPNELNRLGLSDKAKYLDKDFILNAIYTFAEDIKKREIEYAENHDLPDVRHFYESELDNRRSSPVLRLGAYKGFLSNTIDMVIRANDPDFYRYLRFGAHRPYPDEFPKTRRAVVEDGNPKYPLGWLKLEVKNNE